MNKFIRKHADKIAALSITVPFAILAWTHSGNPKELAILTGVGCVIMGLFYVAMEKAK